MITTTETDHAHFDAVAARLRVVEMLMRLGTLAMRDPTVGVAEWAMKTADAMVAQIEGETDR